MSARRKAATTATSSGGAWKAMPIILTSISRHAAQWKFPHYLMRLKTLTTANAKMLIRVIAATSSSVHIPSYNSVPSKWASVVSPAGAHGR